MKPEDKTKTTITSEPSQQPATGELTDADLDKVTGGDGDGTHTGGGGGTGKGGGRKHWWAGGDDGNSSANTA